MPASSVDRVRQAEEDLATASAGITAATPLADATAEFNSAAFALQITWSRVLLEGGCLSDEEQAQALEQVTAYTVDAQTRLQAAGYDPGEIDGIYGPNTVAAVKQLQADSGLRETGFLDAATTAALDAKLAEAAHAGDGGGDDRDRRGAGRAHGGRVLVRSDRRQVDGRVDAGVDGVPDRARRAAHGDRRRRHDGSVPTGAGRARRHRAGRGDVDDAARHDTAASDVAPPPQPEPDPNHCRRDVDERRRGP